MGFILFTLLASFIANAEDTMPLSIFQAAERRSISNDSIDYQLLQLRSIAQWNTAQENLELAKKRSLLAKSDLQKSEELFKKGHVSKDELANVKFRAESSANLISQIENEIQQSKAAAIVFDLRLRAAFDPSKDYRPQIVRAFIDEYQAEKRATVAALATANLEQEISSMRLKAGEKQKSKDAISESALEHREWNHAGQVTKVKILQHKLQMIDLSLEALRNNLKILDQ